MPTVRFAQALQRHVTSPPLSVDGGTVRSALDAAFALNPIVRTYILDDQNAVRKHMTIFVDGRMITDRKKLTDAVLPTSEIYVVQALSGG
jgi:sulfur-carrier protein